MQTQVVKLGTCTVGMVMSMAHPTYGAGYLIEVVTFGDQGWEWVFASPLIQQSTTFMSLITGSRIPGCPEIAVHKFKFRLWNIIKLPICQHSLNRPFGISPIIGSVRCIVGDPYVPTPVYHVVYFIYYHRIACLSLIYRDFYLSIFAGANDGETVICATANQAFFVFPKYFCFCYTGRNGTGVITN